MIKHLKANRRRFLQWEEEFVKSFCKKCNPDICRRKVLQEIESELAQY